MKPLHKLALLGAGVLLAGCAVGPDYKKPDLRYRLPGKRALLFIRVCLTIARRKEIGGSFSTTRS